MDISIIVVCYKGWERLRKCLDSLDRFRGDKFRFEVIVVDNNSDDGTISELKAEHPRFRFIHNPLNGGYANGNNLGARNASGEFILVLNPDTEALEGEIEKMLDIARSHPEYSIISCRQVNEKGKLTPSTGQFPRFGNLTGFQRSLSQLIKGKVPVKRDPLSKSVICPDWISGSVVWMKRDLYEKFGGFYEGFWMYYEDVDLCKRVTESGGKVVSLDDVTIEHNHGGSSRINLSTAAITKAEVQISKHLYISRNMKGAEGFITQVFLVINNIISGALMALAGIVFFFVPKIFIRTVIFKRLLEYYAGSIVRKSWISPRSVIFRASNVKKS